MPKNAKTTAILKNKANFLSKFISLEVSKFLHQIQFLNNFHMMYGPIFDRLLSSPQIKAKKGSIYQKERLGDAKNMRR